MGNDTRAVRASLVPLGAIAAVFFLPTYRACSDQAFESPADYAARSLFDATWVVPVFLCAGLLALLTVRALSRGEMDRFTRRAGLALVAMFGLAGVGNGLAMTIDQPGEWPWLVAAGAAGLAAAAVVRHAYALRPWQIWEHLVAAYAVISVATIPSVFLGGDLLTGHFGSLGVGAYLFLGAQLVLWLVLAPALLRSRGATRLRAV